jgi:hypothetical protein
VAFFHETFNLEVGKPPDADYMRTEGVWEFECVQDDYHRRVTRHLEKCNYQLSHTTVTFSLEEEDALQGSE